MIFKFVTHIPGALLEPFLNGLIPLYQAQLIALGLEDLPAFVRYEPEPKEKILSLEEIIRVGYADCEDLAIVAAAIARNKGYAARVSVIPLRNNNELHARCIVSLPTGAEIVIDYSLLRGMAKYFDPAIISKIMTP